MNIFQESFSNKNKCFDSFIPLICEGAQNHLIFAKEKSTLRRTAKIINKEFFRKDKSTKQLKLAIVKVLSLLQQCPLSVLNNDGDKWFRFCMKNLSNTCVPFVKCLLAIITFILQASVENKGLHRKLTSNVPNLIKKLCCCKISVREHSFRCLYEILRLYPTHSFPLRKDIEKKIMKVLTTPFHCNYDVVYTAASVFAVLPVPGGGNAAPEMKGCQLEQLISLGHHAADAAFYGIAESGKYRFTRKHKLPTETIEAEIELKNNISRILTASLVIGNCFEFIKIFFEKCTTQFISIKPIVLMNLCFRILRMEQQSLKENNSVEGRTLVFILPSLHSRAINLLQYLIQNNFCTFTMILVETQLVSMLKSTNETSLLFGLKKDEAESNQNTETMLKTFLSVRIQCYEALIEVAKTAKGLHGSLIEGLVVNLLTDIKPIKDIISLNQATKGGRLSLVNTKKKSKKKGYSVTTNQGRASLSQVPLSRVMSQKIPLTISALKLIEAIFTYAHHSLHLKYIKQLQDALMDLLKTRRIGIYGDARVRECLFSAVIANFQHPHPLCPPQFNYLQMAFQNEAQFYREQVSPTVARGLATLSSICSNPNTVQWSDIVNLNTECKEVEIKKVSKEPDLNGDVEIDEGMSDSENDETLEDVDDYSVEGNETLELNLDYDDDDDDDNDLEDNEKESEECKEVETKKISKEPDLNGDVEIDEGMSDSENDETLEDADDYSVEGNEALELNLGDDDDDDSDLEDNERESEGNDITYVEDAKQSDDNNEKKNSHISKNDGSYCGFDGILEDLNHYDEDLEDDLLDSSNDHEKSKFSTEEIMNMLVDADCSSEDDNG